jgi:phenylalanyl-tRNA synthetase beta chain
MKITRRWLEDWLPIPMRDPRLRDRLTEGGFEVETLQILSAPFSGVCVAAIQSVDFLQDGRLRVCRLEAGGRLATVVSGAPNLEPGQRVAWAAPGARLPGRPRLDERRFHDVLSSGMLCSEQELGIGARSDRILALPGEGATGAGLDRVLEWPDVLFEIDVTPNRGDCLSALGLAREISALTGVALSRTLPGGNFRLPHGRALRIDVPSACSRFIGLEFELLDPRIETPLALRMRLARLGIEPIHPVVDVTQYVMMELGQPLHAYDAGAVGGGEIRVRWARKGESLALLNQQTVGLDESFLVVASPTRPLGLAGVMGGREAAVQGESRHIFLESAHFSPEAIVGRARRINCSSEAALRFERGVDPVLPAAAIGRAVELLAEIYGPAIRFVSRSEAMGDPHRPRGIRFEPSLVQKKLGCRLQRRTLRKYLEATRCAVETADSGFQVTPPSCRYDLRAPEDLVEEVARLHGYAHLPTRPLTGALRRLPQDPSRAAMEKWRGRLAERGYQETISLSLVDPDWDQAFAIPEESPLPLLNPLARDQSTLRRSLWPCLVRTLVYNQAREQKRLRIFEMGSVFHEQAGRKNEHEEIAGLWNGSANEMQWGTPDREVDFYDVKLDLESLLISLPGPLRFRPSQHAALDPAECACLFWGERRIGFLGALHPGLQRRWEVKGKTYLWSLNLNELDVFFEVEYKAPPRFPSMRRDLAFELPVAVPVGDVEAALLVAGRPTLVEVRLFDVYAGAPLQEGFRSLAFSLIFRDEHSTLTEKAINDLCEKAVVLIEGEFHGRLRR